MNNKKLFIFFLLITSFVSAQTVDKPMRFDFKFGIPGLYGLNAEYVTPLLGNRTAFYLSYHGFNSNYHHDDLDERIRYFDGGVNIFLKDSGNGFYGALGYGHMYIDADFSEVVDIEGQLQAEVYGEFKANTINLKLGFKTKGRIFFRGEAGYGFGDIPKSVTVNSSINDQNDTAIIERPYYPGMSDSGYALATIGVGFAF